MSNVAYFELPAKDPGKIKRFYTKIFGWNYTKWDKYPYWMIDQKKGNGLPGGIYLSEKMKGVVLSYEVPDLATAVKKAQAAGGKIFMETDEGNHIYLKDPEGTIFGIWQTKK